MDHGTTAGGRSLKHFTLGDGAIEARVTNLGAVLTHLFAPDRGGDRADVVLGFDDLDAYLGNPPYFGAIIGRVANRIAGGRFHLDGRDHEVARNDGPNALHGGRQGFDKRIWDVLERTDAALTLGLLSPDGEEGYPGNLRVQVRYRVAEGGLRIDYEAQTDAATPINLTNHSYFNLSGAGRGTILDHEVEIFADHYTPVDATFIPTGEIAPVAGTPMDFRAPRSFGERIEQVHGGPGGYDHNYVLRKTGGGTGGGPTRAARVRDPRSGRVLEAWTTEPGLQVYTGNFLDGSVVGKGGVAYGQRSGFCLEAQHFPDSVHQPGFPSTILRPGDTARQTTLYRFSAE